MPDTEPFFLLSHFCDPSKKSILQSRQKGKRFGSISLNKCSIQSIVYCTPYSLGKNKRKSWFFFFSQNGSQIINDYRAKVDNGSDTSNRSSNALDVYDALWSIAFVLHNSRDELLRQGKSLENLTYGDVNATAVFRRHAQNLDFPTPSIGVRQEGIWGTNRENLG